MTENSIEFRVRYKETDQMGVVYYSNYFVWFEMARTELFRAAGLDYKKIEEDDKIYLPVAEARCRYKTPLRYDDWVTVNTRLSDMGVSRLTFEYEVKREGIITAMGSTKHAFVDTSGHPIPIPNKIRDILV